MPALRRLLLAWWRRPARTPSWVRALLALALGSLALVSLASAASPLQPGGAPTSLPNAPDKSPEPPGPGASTTSFPSSAALVTEGQSLYENGCSSCHGTLLQGQSGVAPSLIGVGAGPIDFYLSTGRMPLQNPRDEPERAPALYKRGQINALIAFITKTGGGPKAPAANPAAGNLADGIASVHLELRRMSPDRRPRRTDPRRLRA